MERDMKIKAIDKKIKHEINKCLSAKRKLDMILETYGDTILEIIWDADDIDKCREQTIETYQRWIGETIDELYKTQSHLEGLYSDVCDEDYIKETASNHEEIIEKIREQEIDI
jgi:hypothetical protein